ncbi:MAG: BatD family protein [Woeseiaceae bacterium]
MVNVRLILLFTLLLSVQAMAGVTASIDRADIELNESFTLEITSDSNIEMQPDIAVLENDFHVGQSNQLSNTTIMNGQIRRSKTWSYVLMPKRAGQIVIPAISVGGESSNPLIVDVTAPTYSPPGEAEVFITTEVDFEESYVQAQILLTTKIYRAVAVRQPALRNSIVTGAEVLVELAGDDRNYEAVINGTPYSVLERVHAIYPQESGEIELSPARFEARVLRNGRITGRKVYESESLTVTVLPTPPPPVDYPDAVWLPARDLQLTEDWSRDNSEVKAGEPLTRHVTVGALGQLETQIPVIDPPSAEGMNVYPDKPELGRIIEPGGIRGVRKDQYALIGVAPGTVVLPALELPWWNVGTGEWEVATLPERTIEVLSSGEAPVATQSEPQQSAGTGEPVTVTVHSELWRRVSEILAALLVITLFSWWWSARPKRAPREPAPVPIHKQQAKFLKSARKAALAADAATVRGALIEWASLQWPEDAPRSIGNIALRVAAPLSDELLALSRLSYGPETQEWNGAALAKALRSFAVLRDDASESEEILPPLMPATNDRN